MKEKIEEIRIRFKHKFYKWIYEDDLRNANGDIDAPKMEKDLSDFIGQEISTLIQEERKKDREMIYKDIQANYHITADEFYKHYLQSLDKGDTDDR